METDENVVVTLKLNASFIQGIGPLSGYFSHQAFPMASNSTPPTNKNQFHIHVHCNVINFMNIASDKNIEF